MLAALDHNFNCNRGQKITMKKVGKKIVLKHHFNIAYRKPTKKFVARKRYEPKKYDYMCKMLQESRKNVVSGTKNMSTPLRKRIAPTQREDRNKMVRMSSESSRFQNQKI